MGLSVGVSLLVASIQAPALWASSASKSPPAAVAPMPAAPPVAATLSPAVAPLAGVTSLPVLEALHPTQIVVPPSGPGLSWPKKGESAIGVQGVGLMAGSARQSPVPIASLTKLMTAYLVLQDHPLAPGQQGPSLKMTGWSVLDWKRVVAADGSNVEVRVGEVLSEHQLLEALLLPSADNVADVLGAWDAGNDHAFVAKMNATARHLGLTATQYADDSGISPSSVSNAVDQEALAADLMENPVVRAIVDQRRLPFPVVGTISNVNPALGADGIVGLKSGYTSEAGGCLATAAYRSVGGHRVLVVTVTLGQPKALEGAAKADETLLGEASHKLEAVTVTSPNERVAMLKLPWSPVTVAALAPPTPATVVGWPKLQLTEQMVPASDATLLRAATATSAASPASGGEAATEVGTLEVDGPQGPLAEIPLVASARLPPIPATLTPTASS